MSDLEHGYCTCGRSRSDQCWQCCQMRDGTVLNDLITCDVGELTHGLRDNVKDVSDIWMRLPVRRCKFGQRELQDLRESCLALQILLREIDKQPALKVVSNG